MSPSYDEGYRAFLDGKPITAQPHWCPYKAANWTQGWTDAEKEAKQEKRRKKR